MRTRAQRLLIAVNVVILFVGALATGAFGYGWWRFGQVARVEVGADAFDEVDDPDPEPRTVPKPPAQNWLLVGSDSRAFVADEEQAGAFGDADAVEGQRADTIMVVRLEPEHERVALLSIPRDLYVTVQPSGREDRVNSAFQDGPDPLIRTIREQLDLPIHHYAQIDFAGFQELVDVLGGVVVPLEHPIRDREGGRNPTGLDIRETGCVELSGEQALAYVRARHVQQMVDGRWVPELRGDLDRIERQQGFLREAAGQAVAQGLASPMRLDDMVRAVTGHLSLDPGVGLQELLVLARAMAAADPAAIEGHSLPVDNATRRSASVLVLRDAEAAPVLERFRATPPPPDPAPAPDPAAPVPAPDPAEPVVPAPEPLVCS